MIVAHSELEKQHPIPAYVLSVIWMVMSFMYAMTPYHVSYEEEDPRIYLGFTSGEVVALVMSLIISLFVIWCAAKEIKWSGYGTILKTPTGELYWRLHDDLKQQFSEEYYQDALNRRAREEFNKNVDMYVEKYAKEEYERRQKEQPKDNNKLSLT